MEEKPEIKAGQIWHSRDAGMLILIIMDTTELKAVWLSSSRISNEPLQMSHAVIIENGWFVDGHMDKYTLVAEPNWLEIAKRLMKKD